ncbi:MAG TPA: zinc-binding dehydrogenase [Streptosporangiaceae bacterium]|jgi:NADPH2:quinone reductase
MRAVVLREFGPPARLVAEEVPDPVAGPGQVVITAAAAGITFIETMTRAGRTLGPRPLPELPVVLGNGVGGVVTALGPGADPALVGARVVSVTGGTGGYAEQVAVDAAEPIRVPDPLPLPEAVALLADGRTALALAERAAPAAGEWVLVEAAGGGVGSLLVQLAVAAGARVIGAASGERKLGLARERGAAATVDYSHPGWPARVREITGGAGVGLVFDGVGGGIGQAAFGLVADGGTFCVMGAASGSITQPPADAVEQRKVEVIGLWSVQRTPAQLRELSIAALAEAAAGRLLPTIGQTFPLCRAADAHAAIEARATLGKTLLIA